MESYKHKFAKQTLARWLADPNQPFFGDGGSRTALLEYPFCVNGDGKLLGGKPWHEAGLNGVTDFENGVPTYQQCLDAKLLPVCIFDVVIYNGGRVPLAFEIVHKHSLTEEKRGYIRRVMGESCLMRVYGLDADWVLSQVGLPPALRTIWTISRWDRD